MTTHTVTDQQPARIVADAKPNVIPENYLLGLDPEWQRMWTEHGKDVSGAHLVTIEEFKRCPEKYSFSYPTWAGKFSLPEA